MDEPFSALDVQTRVLMQRSCCKLWVEAKASVVFVTHDLEEAIALADKVYVLTAGPATVKAVYTIDLPRPRVVAEIRYEPRFIDYSRTIWDDLQAKKSRPAIAARRSRRERRQRHDRCSHRPRPPVFRPGTSDAEIEAAAARAARRRARKVIVWRLVILVVLLGVWEIGARSAGSTRSSTRMPSAIVERLWEWIDRRHVRRRPLWYHLWVTMEEAAHRLRHRLGRRRRRRHRARPQPHAWPTSSRSTSRCSTRSRASCWRRSSS